MRELLLYIVAPAIVSWFAYRAWLAAWRFVRRDAKEAAALAVAEQGGPFSKAYGTVVELNGRMTANPHRVRDERRWGAV